jgi:hypothetical protein
MWKIGHGDLCIWLLCQAAVLGVSFPGAAAQYSKARLYWPYVGQQAKKPQKIGIFIAVRKT